MRRIVLGLLLASLVVACGGGGGGSQGDPVAAVNAVLDTMKSKQFDKLPPLICAAKRDAVTKRLDFSEALASLPTGIDAKTLIDAMTIDFKDRSVTQKSIDGDKAVVAVKGTMTITLDDAKGKQFVKAILEANGQDASDAAVDAMWPSFKDNMAKGTTIDSEGDVVKEDGTWVVCSDFTASGDEPGPSPS